MASIATFLFEELAKRVEKIAVDVRSTECSNNFFIKLKEWQSHRVLVYNYMDGIYRCFALILLIITVSGFIDGITLFAEFALVSFTKPIDGLKVLHNFLQFFAVLFVTSRANAAVSIICSA